MQVGRDYRRRFLSRTEEQVEALYLGVSPERLWVLTLLGAAGGALLMAVFSGFSAVAVIIGATAGFLAPRIYLAYLEQQRRRKFNAQLVDSITLLASAMRSGSSLLQAIEKITHEMGAPIRQEFAYALQENRVGKPIMQALEDMKDRIRSEDLTITVNSIGIALETGGVLSEVLFRIAETVRERTRIRNKIDSMTAQGRLQGIIMALIPWGLGGAMLLLDRTLMRPMFTTTVGLLILAFIVVLEILGWLMIRKLIAVDV